MLLQHLLQEQRSPRLFELGPVLFTAFIKFVLIWYVPDRLDVELVHLFSAASMNSAIIKEQIELILVTCGCSDFF